MSNRVVPPHPVSQLVCSKQDVAFSLSSHGIDEVLEAMRRANLSGVNLSFDFNCDAIRILSEDRQGVLEALRASGIHLRQIQ